MKIFSIQGWSVVSDYGYVCAVLCLQPWVERGGSRKITDTFNPLQAVLLLHDNLLVSVTLNKLNNFFI